MATTEAKQKKARRILRFALPLLNLLVWTWRIRYVNKGVWQRLLEEGKPIIFSLWHGELLASAWALRKRGVVVMVSEHGDGELIAQVIESWGFKTIRGSTSRGAGRVLLQMVRGLQEGGAAYAITPDGPRGPSGRVQPGILLASNRAQASIVPMRVWASSFWRLKSWDRFTVPKPFARVTVTFGIPWVAGGTEEADAQHLVERMGAPHGVVPAHE